MDIDHATGVNHRAPAPDATTAPEKASWREAALMLGTCLPVLGTVLITSVLPAMQAHFAAVPGVAVLVPVTMVIPSLVIALVSPVAGLILDLLGRRHLLGGALVAYACIGTAPLWLNSLPAIVISRALLGVAEGIIIVSITILICDWYSGLRRDRFLGLQTVVANGSAMVFFALGGVLGNAGWRVPFLVFAVSLLLVPIVVRYLPARRPAWTSPVHRTGGRRRLAPLPWRRLPLWCLLTLFGSIIFSLPVVQTTYLLDQIGVTSAQTIGMVAALTGLATVVGAAAFVLVSATSPNRLLITGFGLAGLGFAVIAGSRYGSLAAAGPVTVLGLTIACVGCGLLLPTLLTATMRLLGYEQRGRGTGMWVASFFLGQFCSPLVMMATTRAVGGLLAAFGVFAGVCVLTAAALTGRRLAYRGARRAGFRPERHPALNTRW